MKKRNFFEKMFTCFEIYPLRQTELNENQTFVTYKKLAEIYRSIVTVKCNQIKC